MACFEVVFFSLIKTYLAPKPIKQQEITLLCRRLGVLTGFPARTEPAQTGLDPGLGFSLPILPQDIHQTPGFSAGAVVNQLQ